MKTLRRAMQFLWGETLLALAILAIVIGLFAKYHGDNFSAEVPNEATRK